MPADVVSIVSFSITCFQGCVKGLVILSKAKHYNEDVSAVQFQTQLILHSLMTWAKEAGLTQEPPTLEVSANHAPRVPEILGQLKRLFSDINELKRRYGINLQRTDEDVDVVDDDVAASLLDADVQEGERTERIDVTVFRKRKQPWKRLRWVTLDDQKFDRLLDKANGYVRELGRFLEQARQERMEKYLEFCVRHAIVKAEDQLRLGIIGKEYQRPVPNHAISSAAKLKQIRLDLGIFDQTREVPMTTLQESSTAVATASRNSSITMSTGSGSGPITSNSKGMQLRMRLLTLDRAARAQPHRTLAPYDGRTVLVEWKYVTCLDDSTISTRVNQVAAFLQALGPTLHSLQCRGFVTDRVSNRYGYIFDLPDELHSSPSPSPSYHSQEAVHINVDVRKSGVPSLPHSTPQYRPLREMLDQPGMVSLNTKLSLAVTLLETLLDLHTAGWLHKEFRSDNIYLIRKADNNTTTTNNNNLLYHGAAKDDLSTYSAYIAGYVSSRLDRPDEMTEPLKSELEADLYRHPALLSDVRQPYRKSFDIFSVGCTLLEIGLWLPLRRILEAHSVAARPEPQERRSPSIPERASDQTLVNGNLPDASGEVLENERQHPANKSEPSLDLMELKHELLCSHLPDHPKNVNVNMATQEFSLAAGASGRGIMVSLEATMGKRYTNIVEGFLAAGNATDHPDANEHEYALHLEMRARDTVRAIAEAV
ncbi:hypothetical protein A1O3_02069 [Capronia epimyces CBS 606.96]|uniref:Protein kinase domain-containing protein n=1 Tax=Capronia epimyces CBS 606.96 TaxID=1182542 RepID=W9YH70_9EURO|nr:uncharacterized protein A1O3_02069 [Capronia epimyces CBS 606.96]EXJ89005.1 hypothetical protein A1O3_02069 [Capronia epimyces CBS 606.96]